MKGSMRLLILIGIIVALLPILGFPGSVKTAILFAAGISLLLIAFSLRRHIKMLKLKLKRIEGQQGTLIQ